LRADLDAMGGAVGEIHQLRGDLVGEPQQVRRARARYLYPASRLRRQDRSHIIRVQSENTKLLVNAGVIIKTLGQAAGLLAGGISRKIMERRNDGRRLSMTITLPLEPQEEARLKAAAQAKGLSPDAFVREVLDKILAEAAAEPAKPKKSAYGLLAKYGPGPTEEEIDENRREMFRGFGEDLL
jgi:hypothetical protein